jgi:Ser/Thr protein kinase RdoA (MazF antagonist)
VAATSELVGAVLTRPVVDAATARAFLHGGWAVDGAVTLAPLPSERDRNFAVAVDGLEEFVLKVSNATEPRGILAFQHEGLARLRAVGVPSPEPVPGRDGTVIIDARSPDGTPLLVRLMRWVRGRPLATLAPDERPPALLVELGAMMGRAATGLHGWDHPAAHRDFQWDPGRGLAVIDAHAPAVTDPRRAALLAAWRARLAPLGDVIPQLPQGVIHNDANDHNVLVAADGSTITGLLDFGDAVRSAVVCDLSVAAAYAALEAPDPMAVIAAVQRGFEAERPLTSGERAALIDLVALRLATSVALSAHQSTLDPADAYLTVSEAAAWALLERLSSVDRGALGGASADSAATAATART